MVSFKGNFCKHFVHIDHLPGKPPSDSEKEIHVRVDIIVENIKILKANDEQRPILITPLLPEMVQIVISIKDSKRSYYGLWFP